ncbi:6,7-dimethyl-8-ribityllumazine synthase [Cordyceps militaris]|uniref:6,7-dimethyl-8-ribityllumazine synthase n=1 Tax=Cordyceps militaris TaxID=73501 RepID=A0A2H4SAT1_CORMI|nr:6,7-dimethyl-8-ribityllumazine synthase [Cordyceps militaris]
MSSSSLKGPTPQQHDGAGLRIGILDTGVPIIFGVLTVFNDAQALNRAGADGKG